MIDSSYGLQELKEEIDMCDTFSEIVDVQNYLNMVFSDFEDIIPRIWVKLLKQYLVFKANIMVSR